MEHDKIIIKDQQDEMIHFIKILGGDGLKSDMQDIFTAIIIKNERLLTPMEREDILSTAIEATGIKLSKSQIKTLCDSAKQLDDERMKEYKKAQNDLQDYVEMIKNS